MSRKSQKPQAAGQFPVGSGVRVKTGTTDPDFPDMPLGGWTGKVQEVNHEATPPTYLIEWDRFTLHNIHHAYRSRCEREGLDLESMWLDEANLESEKGEPAAIEQPVALVSQPLDLNQEEDRVRAVFGLLTRDEPIPRIDLRSLRLYYEYLVSHLMFPFKGKLSYPIGPHRDTKSPLSVFRLLDPVKEYAPEEMYGLICNAVQKNERIELPLSCIDVEEADPNRQLVADYSFWVSNWQ
jgi:hypothetical protein